MVRSIGISKSCEVCGRPTIGETNWCPFCTSEAVNEPEDMEIEWSQAEGKLVVVQVGTR